MSTKLTSKLTRESTEKVDDREILVTLNEDQSISLKLKGMKTGTVSIGIKELWETLRATDADKPKRAPVKPTTWEQMIPLSRLRAINQIIPGSLEDKQRFDEILSDLIKE